MIDELVVDHPDGCFLETSPHVHIIRRRRDRRLTLGDDVASPAEPRRSIAVERRTGRDRRGAHV